MKKSSLVINGLLFVCCFFTCTGKKIQEDHTQMNRTTSDSVLPSLPVSIDTHSFAVPAPSTGSDVPALFDKPVGRINKKDSALNTPIRIMHGVPNQAELDSIKKEKLKIKK